nr:YkgJ family cysteine cluster protein [Crateriforma conspicua]
MPKSKKSKSNRTPKSGASPESKSVKASTLAPRPPKKRRREDYPADANLCEHCTAKCCHYFALPIEEPASRRDFDFMRWYLLHDRASVFVDSDTWYLLVHTTCKHLQDDHRCGIYETRPQICRDYTTAECEFEDDWCYEKYFESPEQIDEYADAMFGPQFPDPTLADHHALRSRRPTGLPIAVAH